MDTPAIPATSLICTADLLRGDLDVVTGTSKAPFGGGRGKRLRPTSGAVFKPPKTLSWRREASYHIPPRRRDAEFSEGRVLGLLCARTGEEGETGCVLRGRFRKLRRSAEEAEVAEHGSRFSLRLSVSAVNGLVGLRARASLELPGHALLWAATRRWACAGRPAGKAGKPWPPNPPTHIPHRPPPRP